MVAQLPKRRLCQKCSLEATNSNPSPMTYTLFIMSRYRLRSGFDGCNRTALLIVESAKCAIGHVKFDYTYMPRRNALCWFALSGLVQRWQSAIGKPILFSSKAFPILLDKGPLHPLWCRYPPKHGGHPWLLHMLGPIGWPGPLLKAKQKLAIQSHLSPSQNFPLAFENQV